MLRLLDTFYAGLPHSNFINKSFRYLVRVLTNCWARLFMRIYCKNNGIDKDTIIVSLTSFPARIDKIWLTIACLLNQSLENIHIVLWLSNEQFRSKADLPQKLLKLEDKGVEIQLVNDDLRPHKKYYYALQKWPNNPLVTVDDDILYNPDIIKVLRDTARKHPNCVICNRGIIINRGNYNTWETRLNKNTETNNTMPTGVGGVFYPAHIFDNTQIFNIDVIKNTCLYGDDLWLNFWTRYNNRKVVYTGMKTGLITILSSQQSALCNTNIGESRNDVQIRALHDWASGIHPEGFYCNI